MFDMGQGSRRGSWSWISLFFLCSCLLMGQPLFSADRAKIDSFEKILVVPFKVMFHHRATPEELNKLGVPIEVERAKMDSLVALCNGSKTKKEHNTTLDGRVLIIGISNGNTVNIMMDRWLNRLWVDGKIYKLVGKEFSTAIRDLLESRHDAIDATYLKKNFPEPSTK